jgi:hypothetical protein
MMSEDLIHRPPAEIGMEDDLRSRTGERGTGMDDMDGARGDSIEALPAEGEDAHDRNLGARRPPVKPGIDGGSGHGVSPVADHGTASQRQAGKTRRRSSRRIRKVRASCG